MPDENVTPTLTPAKRWRPRFSLGTLILLSLTVSSIILTMCAFRETRVLREENRKLREETGALVIANPQARYVRSVRTLEDKTWRWRVYLPAPGKYSLRCITDGVPESGFPASSSTLTREFAAGEFEILATVNRDKDGNWRAVVACPGGSCSPGINASAAGWITNGSHCSTGAPDTSTEFGPMETVELLRLRQMMKTATGSDTSNPNPCPGLLIWMVGE
ncbi:MAG TPA: hypothetical protein VGP72_08355 [Planctomycetota bacterium]